MILHCNFEELRALSAAVELIVTDSHASSDSAVAAPPEGVARVETLLPRLSGDLSIETLEDQRGVREAVSLIRDNLLVRLDAKILEYHPAHEEAVSLYFDYGYSRGVLERVERMGAEMEAMIELITGERADPVSATSIGFPD